MQQGNPVIGDEASVRTTTVTYDAASSDSVASVLACFAGAQRLFGATTYSGGETRREHHSALSLEAAGIRAGMTLHLLMRLHGGVITPPAATEASLQPSLLAENSEASAASHKDKGPAPRSLTLRDVSIQKRSSRISQLSITQHVNILQDTNL